MPSASATCARGRRGAAGAANLVVGAGYLASAMALLAIIGMIFR